ncbi:MAG: DUF4388 domain-containing protein, partial [Myxococcales bacterium]|nr:DUF4388 domain-containing protein [Myxococcales bacterium]
NGTFVNGKRLEGRTALKAGDKVLVGTSIMELVPANGAAAAAAPARSRADEPSVQIIAPDQGATSTRMPAHTISRMVEATAETPMPAPQATVDRASGMTGRFPDDDVAVPDLVELFVNGGRNGVLILSDAQGREGRMFFRDGQVYFASYADPQRPSEIDPQKAFFRLLSWKAGHFKFETISPPPAFDKEMTGGTREALVEAVRQQDELARYAEHLLPDHARLALKIPLESRLSALSAEALETLQVAINCVEVGLILDYSEASDLETWQDLFYLLQNEYLVQV